MDFKQIEAFVTVVDYKSFSKAADACFLTQPTISARISTLEKELGVRLIDRNGREAFLTDYGKVFYKYAAEMLDTRDRATGSIQDLSKEIKGMVDIQIA
ncbi:LysR family transcriptional regulator [Sinanaerobacter chloroacetimidivorans]|jgi:DNA-binding transcriptional LysR family regulator|uniref:LysR family transcriptional regulator n=1 Tax=Sinanaerobacter chloroacetimidivorans TaxID=2818044 RepID=A0A8J8B176_9FIRM|nr:LysR family transcriptional regulator [Sinanaerobacter chloroacetimidivorans]MBR0597472.1 LysR family transcriptional regulator [Sinanaerobacter chloroacetimidivorans]